MKNTTANFFIIMILTLLMIVSFNLDTAGHPFGAGFFACFAIEVFCYTMYRIAKEIAKRRKE